MGNSLEGRDTLTASRIAEALRQPGSVVVGSRQWLVVTAATSRGQTGFVRIKGVGHRYRILHSDIDGRSVV